MPSWAVSTPEHPVSLPLEIDLSPLKNLSTLPEHLVDAVRNLGPFLPIGCKLLGRGDLKIFGSRPIGAGGFADIWVGEMSDGTKVAIKSFRYYSSSSRLSVYLRLYKEALICSRLNDDDGSFVPLVGVYSTREHPFGLVFKFMDHLNLREYLRNNQDIAALELLLEIARGLRHMHRLGIVHGNIDITNVLVGADGRVRIGGLGAASILSTTPAMNADRSFHGAAPGLIDSRQWGLTDTGATMASDVYSFAILAWEVFAGRPPFADESVVAGVYSMSKGRRPARPDHPELSDRLWKMIKRCWKGDPAQRGAMTEVVAILEVEANAHKSK